MKFGKYILSVSTEWTNYYMNYKALKKIIKGELDDNAEDGGRQHELPSADSIENRKTKFFFRLERELEKVNMFYIQKENELKIRLKALCKKTVVSVSLKEAFLQFQIDLEKLQKFVQVNATGFRKILKKWDKRSKASTKEIYLSRQVEIQPVFNTDILTNLQDRAAAFLQDLEMKLKNADGENNVELYLECPPHVIGFLENNLHDLLQAWVEKHDVPLSRLFLDYCTDTSIECLRVLLDSKRVDCNFRDDINDHTCLHMLSIGGNLPALKLCLQHHAKISLDYYGRSPLHYAALKGHADTCLFLLSLKQHQSIFNQADQDGNTPLINSITAGHLKVLEAFIESGASIEPVEIGSPNQLNTGKIPLTVACQSGHLNIVKYLLSLTKNITLIPPTSDGLTTLHISCRQGQTEITKCLIEHMYSSPIPPSAVQDEINRLDAFTGWTPLFFAAAEGHIGCMKLLLEARCRVDLKDDCDWSARTYCLYRGHMDAAALLLEYEEKKAISDIENANSRNVDYGVLEKETEVRMSGGTLGTLEEKASTGGISNPMAEMDLDDIPSLSLPPPIIPLRIYGHHYLDKKYLVQIQMGSHSTTPDQKHPVCLSGSRQLYSLKLKITANSARDHAFFANLPLKEDLTTYSYSTSTLAHSSMEFDLYPVFGTVAIGTGCLPSSQFHALVQQSVNGVTMPECTIALFDTHLRVLGHVTFRLNLVQPFIHPSLSIGNGRIETYWKSTTVVSNPPSSAQSGAPSSSGPESSDHLVHSLVTASSLVEGYIELIVQCTKDYHIIIYPKASISVRLGQDNVLEIPISNLTLQEARAAFTASFQPIASDPNRYFIHASSSVIANHVYSSFMTLEDALRHLPTSVGFSIIVQYIENESLINMNSFVDKVLKLCYDFSNRRSLIFSSFNQMVCTILNWKQPNYGVFFRTFCGFMNHESRVLQQERFSIKESIKFAKTCSLLGLVCESKALVEMPALVQTIKESGLMLATFGDENRVPGNIAVQEKAGADATIKEYVWKNNQM